MRQSTITQVTILMVLTLLFCCGRLEARTWYVKADGSGDAPSIQAAIYQAASWDTILAAAGHYTGTDNKNIDYMEKTLVVRSESGPQVTIIDCQGVGRGFNFQNGENDSSKVEGFTIINGNVTQDDGGGILCLDNSSPTISNCIVRNSRAEGNGGGICCKNSSSPLISNCTLIKNEATYGGGICCLEGSSPSISNCVVAEDSANYGGGIYLVGGSSSITDCIVVNNKAFIGGGIGLSASSPTISRCTIVGNRATTFCGGISCVNSFPIIGSSLDNRNSIYNNQAGQPGANLRTNTVIEDAQYNFWGRVNDSSADSLAILEEMAFLGGTSINWWPISTLPRNIAYKVRAETDTFWFPEVRIILDPHSMNLGGDSTISMTAWPDSMPPNIIGGKPVEKWFDIAVGSGVGDFSAQLILEYTQAEFDSSDIVDEETIYCARHFADQWVSYPGTADAEDNWVQCVTTELSVWAIGGSGGPLTPVSQAEEALKQPGAFHLSQNYPNPFNASTSISFSLPTGAFVTLDIYNILGQKVRTLMNGHLLPGRHVVTWDGSDSQGQRASSGLYFCRLEAAGFRQTRKVMLLR